MYKSWLGMLFIGVLLSIALSVAPLAAQSVTPIVSATQGEGALAAAQSVPIQDWVQLATLILALAVAVLELRKRAKADGKKLRWENLKSLVPTVHALVQKIAAMTHTKKDDKFLEKICKLAQQVFGYEITAAEREPLKILAEAYHQEYKLRRDGGEPVIINAAEIESAKPVDPPQSSAGS